MRITHLGHACVLVEMAGSRLLIDPGTFADDLTGITDIDAIVVTHQHADHLDPGRLPGLVAANPDAVVLCDPRASRSWPASGSTRASTEATPPGSAPSP